MKIFSCTASRSRRPARALHAALLLVGLLVFPRESPGASADEQSVLRLWALHRRDPTNHTAFAARAAQTEEALAGRPLAAVGLGLAAWHALQAGDEPGARRALDILSRTTGDTALERSARVMALRWLSRLEREKVCRALRAYYLAEIEYPASLEVFAEWPEAKRPPAKDAWGDPWAYRPVSFRRIRGDTRGQRYALESRRLGSASDLASALAEPYPAMPALKVERVMNEGGAGLPTVVFAADQSRDKIVINEGGAIGGLTLAYVGEILLVFSDNERWLLAGRGGSE